MWKVWLLVGSLLLIFAFGLTDYIARFHGLLATVGGALFLVFTVPWMFYGIRCRACGGRPFARLMHQFDGRQWPAIYFSMQRCPLCGDDAFHKEA